MTQVFKAVYQQQNVLFLVKAWFPSWFIIGLTKFSIKIQQTQLGTCEPNLFPMFYQVTQSKFDTNRSRGSLVMIGHSNKQTNRQTN